MEVRMEKMKTSQTAISVIPGRDAGALELGSGMIEYKDGWQLGELTGQ